MLKILVAIFFWLDLHIFIRRYKQKYYQNGLDFQIEKYLHGKISNLEQSLNKFCFLSIADIFNYFFNILAPLMSTY